MRNLSDINHCRSQLLILCRKQYRDIMQFNMYGSIRLFMHCLVLPDFILPEDSLVSNMSLETINTNIILYFLRAFGSPRKFVEFGYIDKMMTYSNITNSILHKACVITNSSLIRKTSKKVIGKHVLENIITSIVQRSHEILPPIRATPIARLSMFDWYNPVTDRLLPGNSSSSERKRHVILSVYV